MNDLTKKDSTTLHALTKARKHCAYQERCQFDMRMKLHAWGLNEEQTEWIISELIVENFINEERFANEFVKGKFHIKSWGKQKIIYALHKRQISERCIQKAVQGIDEQNYMNLIDKLAKKWLFIHRELSPNEQIKKLSTFLFSKGFEYEKIKEYIFKNLK